MKTPIFNEADILLPDFPKCDKSSWRKWAVIACDQFTSDLQYWENVRNEIGGCPSTLDMFLPEAYLGTDTSITAKKISVAMHNYEQNLLKIYSASMIYLERTFTNGKIRAGIVGAFDLDAYDYAAKSRPKIRATEGTVLERIPPRVKIRESASVELPHVMVFVDDREKKVIEPLHEYVKGREPIYDFTLMQDGGSVTGWLLEGDIVGRIKSALAGIESGDFPYAMGDGNHSFAAAKAYREQIKKSLSDEESACHPSRYALAELVNLNSEAIVFEPIYRVVFGSNINDLCNSLEKICGADNGQRVLCITSDCEREMFFDKPSSLLTVGTLQNFLDTYAAAHPEIEVTYIHGEEDARKLGKQPGNIAFIFDGMDKSELFPYVDKYSALPRKTFSMGDAREKRYYLEARKIK